MFRVSNVIISFWAHLTEVEMSLCYHEWPVVTVIIAFCQYHCLCAAQLASILNIKLIKFVKRLIRVTHDAYQKKFVKIFNIF